MSENQDTLILQNQEDTAATVAIPVLGLTQAPPVLKEEYDNYALVQFVSLSTWKQIQRNNRNCRTRHLYPYAVGKRENLNRIKYDRNSTNKCSRTINLHLRWKIVFRKR